ncbi:MAG TPA: glycosyltransferase [Candidatus Saccharimonadales bacterium]|nr:glycosyltransferase [Candidatus Saccharimonadales bacterium]
MTAKNKSRSLTWLPYRATFWSFLWMGKAAKKTAALARTPHPAPPPKAASSAAPRVAIVADWLTNMGGAERVVLALHEAYPEAPIFTSVFEPSAMPLFKDADVRTTWLQKFPRFLRKKHQLFPVFRALVFPRIDLSAYDIIISSASAEAKAVTAAHTATHICYLHTPIRYYWSHYDQYRQRPGFGPLDPVIRLLIPPFVRWMRPLDLKAVGGVDYFIANSHEVQKRITQYYHRQSTVIYPPVGVKRLKPHKPVKKEDYYLVVGRQIPYKRMDLAITACNKLGKRLIVIGRGSEHEALVRLGGPTVEFKTNVNDHDIVAYFQQAKALIWPQEEDFGVTAVEAMAAGTPVIAYQKGGASDYVKDGVTGLLFKEQTEESLIQAMQRCEKKSFDSQAISAYAEQFSEAVFIQKIHDFVATHHR